MTEIGHTIVALDLGCAANFKAVQCAHFIFF